MGLAGNYPLQKDTWWKHTNLCQLLPARSSIHPNLIRMGSWRCISSSLHPIVTHQSSNRLQDIFSRRRNGLYVSHPSSRCYVLSWSWFHIVLYSTYIIMFAVMSPTLGVFADKNNNPRVTVFYIGALQFTLIGVVLLCSTFVPKGALTLNPELESDEDSK